MVELSHAAKHGLARLGLEFCVRTGRPNRKRRNANGPRARAGGCARAERSARYTRTRALSV